MTDGILLLVVNSLMLGIGLAMDAFSVSVANGLNEPKMKGVKMVLIALTFALFQAVMPLIGWVCVKTVARQFEVFNYAVPWIALILLGFIGGKMIFENVKKKEEQKEEIKSGLVSLLVQGVATSIDALSVGFTIAEYELLSALLCASIIAVVTFGICLVGVFIGKKFGGKFSGKAEIFGGIILIIIGIEIFITGIL